MKIKTMRNGVIASEIILKLLPSGDHEIAYLRTAIEYRGKGYASALIEKAKTKFPRLVAFLEGDGTGLNVDQMERWYKRHGFKRVKYNLGRIWDKNIKTVMYWEDQQAEAS